MQRFSVYRFYAEDGTLLYVGRSGQLPRRIKEHFKTKPWFTEASRIELEHFDTFEEMATREAQLIHESKPRYNVAMNGPPAPRPAVVSPPARFTEYEFPWQEPWARPEQVADAYGVTRATLKQWMADGMPWMRMGASPRFQFSRIEPWLAERGITTPA